MPDTRERLSHVTVALHWLIAAAVIAMIVFGLYVEDLERGEGEALLGLHAAIGVVVLGFALARIVWRTVQGFPPPVGDYSAIETRLAKIVHWALLIGTVAMPVSGMMAVLGDAGAIDVFGLFTIGPVTPQRIHLLEDAGEVIHETGSNLLILAIVVHVAGALKHHLLDRDATIKRMLGVRAAE